jgi:hypothetical protein
MEEVDNTDAAEFEGLFGEVLDGEDNSPSPERERLWRQKRIRLPRLSLTDANTMLRALGAVEHSYPIPGLELDEDLSRECGRLARVVEAMIAVAEFEVDRACERWGS